MHSLLALFEEVELAKTRKYPAMIAEILQTEEYQNLYTRIAAKFMLTWAEIHHTEDLSLQLEKPTAASLQRFLRMLKHQAHESESKVEALIASRIIWLYIEHAAALASFKEELNPELDYLESVIGQ